MRRTSRLNGLSVYGTVGGVSLGLNKNLVESERVLVDAPIDSFVTALADMLRRICTRAAVPDGDEDIEHQLLKEGGRLIENSLKHS